MELYCAIFVAALSVLNISLAVKKDPAPFPCGYKYMSQAEAWFKIHTSVASWSEAKRICNLQGAQLASPNSDVIKSSMISLMHDKNTRIIHTGLFRKADGKSIALSDNGALEPINEYSIFRYLPYICYKKAPQDLLNDCVGIIEPVYAARNPFPCGYKYMSQAEAWFKIHTSGASWKEALRTCLSEGAKLASPKNDVIKGSMISLMNNLAKDARLVHTAWRPDEAGFNMALSDRGTLESVNQNDRYLPFICYKKTKTQDLQRLQLNECGGYSYDYRTNKCYKFDSNKTSWWSADPSCSRENGRLAVINSKVEAQVIRELFARNPPNTISAVWKDVAFVGYEKKRGKWVTITGQSLESSLSISGYEGWSEGEPTDLPGRKEDCGAVGRNGRLFDTACGIALSFICVKRPESCQEFNWSGKPKPLCACF